MRIAVVNNCAPFVTGGAEHLASALTTKLNEYGHSAELFRIPFQWEPADRILESVAACRFLRICSVDRIVALKFPAYYVPHPNKVLWLLHQFRQAYDLWGTPFQTIPATPEGLAIRACIIQSDNEFLREALRIYTNSHITSTRLKRFNDIESLVLHPPLLSAEHFRCDGYGDFVFYPSRINEAKRQHLVVEAMKYVKSPVRLVVAGRPESAEYAERLWQCVQENGLERRVRLMLEFITEREKAELYANAIGTVYIPYDEDSYGYVPLESFHSGKAVLTCTDSGGTDVLVRHGETGLVAPPDPKALAAAFDTLFLDKANAIRMGEAGRELIGRLNISWDHVIASLTS